MIQEFLATFFSSAVSKKFLLGKAPVPDGATWGKAQRKKRQNESSASQWYCGAVAYAPASQPGLGLQID